MAVIKYLTGENFILSNFTANLAKPGSDSKERHSDLSLVHPSPWDEPWSIYIIWVLNDMREENGANHYLPYSQKINRPSDLPHELSWEMPYWSSIREPYLMKDQRWHASRANIARKEERDLLFTYCLPTFTKPQWNFSVEPTDRIKSSLPDRLEYRLGLKLAANIDADCIHLTEKWWFDLSRNKLFIRPFWASSYSNKYMYR